MIFNNSISKLEYLIWKALSHLLLTPIIYTYGRNILLQLVNYSHSL